MHQIAICDDEFVIRKQLRTMLIGHPLAGEPVLPEFDSGEALSVSQTYRKEVKELLFMQFPTGG